MHRCLVAPITVRPSRCPAPSSPGILSRAGRSYTHGGRRPTGIDAVEWAARVEALGAGEILLMSMDRDGTRDGYDMELTRAVTRAVSIPVIASGGAGTLEHLREALDDGIAGAGASAVLAASIFHFGTFRVPQAKSYLAARGILVRPIMS